ncbi:arabinan endo-1,5-alpha-L-arabinosidase [Christiangramia fulva]|uniref:Arabinan endo-1,5-alpha-L-arabinosidase n=1 Tax=Christiangramia fulva TaxID=2126553 RepID=A0A2R3Z7L0_9FLAO|nr:arabinan endo-1,5-alpha-L-arabinosidase [Christiangramia fulva]AVR46222.1 arabinan endo-1,5-alpha-L-arabinosidase [Christiangramia fulva]
MKKHKLHIWVFILGIVSISLFSCSKDDPKDPGPNPAPGEGQNGGGEENPTETGIDFTAITDTYYDVAGAENVYSWGLYNVHDPSIIKAGDTYYSYSTDVSYGSEIRPGIQIRKSKNLIKWSFLGWVFDGLPEKGSQFIKSKGDDPFQSLWAPYAMEYNGEYRLYYSLSSPTPRLSVIGLATASSPLGPWTEKGLVVTSQNDNTVQTNAIDPTVVKTPAGEQWLYYGSAWDGIYVLALDPSTGLPKNPGSKGTRVAQRGFTGGKINGNIEGAEVIYNSDFEKYYMFISYDWLQTKYNVRVGRSDSPEGPFYDFNGDNLNEASDNIPMILAPYKFNGHSGWQGVAHPTVFNNGKGQYFIAHQGRPGVDSYFMDLHVRKIHWTKDGWPVVSPERFADVEQSTISENDLVGTYEQIILGYSVVPGFADEQTSPDFQTSISLELNADGSINGDSANSWTYDAPWLTLNWGNGFTDKLYVEYGRDWENNIDRTILLTGLNNEGTAVWGKKID